MTEEFPWADPAILARLSRQPIGAQLAGQVAERLVADRGNKGIWNSHRDYCGHGLIYLEGVIRLVEVHDGMVRDGVVLKAWNSGDEFTRWLARQSDHSLSGSEPDEPILHCSNPFRLNNQRLRRARLAEYASGKEILPAFRDYVAILETAFALLVDEFGFEMTPSEMIGRECEVVFRVPSRSAISVVCEPFCTPQLSLSLNAGESGESISNAPLTALARQPACQSGPANTDGVAMDRLRCRGTSGPERRRYPPLQSGLLAGVAASTHRHTDSCDSGGGVGNGYRVSTGLSH